MQLMCLWNSKHTSNWTYQACYFVCVCERERVNTVVFRCLMLNGCLFPFSHEPNALMTERQTQGPVPIWWAVSQSLYSWIPNMTKSQWPYWQWENTTYAVRFSGRKGITQKLQADLENEAFSYKVLKGKESLWKESERVQAWGVIFGMLLLGHIPGASGQLWFSPSVVCITHAHAHTHRKRKKGTWTKNETEPGSKRKGQGRHTEGETRQSKRQEENETQIESSEWRKHNGNLKKK